MKHFSSLYRISIGLFCSYAFLSGLCSLGMQNIQATYSYDGQQLQQTTIPFFVETEEEFFDIDLTFSLNRYHASRFIMGPDDCIEELIVNGKVYEEMKGRCNTHPGFVLLLDNLQERNTMHIRIHDFGGEGGISIRPSWKDSVFLSVLLLCILALSWTGKEILELFGSGKEVKRFPLLLLVALLIRIGLSWHGGFGADIHLNRQWAMSAAKLGVVESYSKQIYPKVMLPNYPPLSMEMFRWTGVVHEVIHPQNNFAEPPNFRFIKMPGMLADLLVIIVLFWLLIPIAGRRFAFVGSTIYALHPAVIHNSAIWGQTDAIFTLFLCLTLLCIQRERWFCTGMAFAAALLFKMQALILLPIIVVAVLPSLRRWLKVAVGGIAIVIVVLMPFAYNDSMHIIYDIYKRSVGFYPSLSLNAYNIWVMLYSRDTGLASTEMIFNLLSYRTLGMVLWVLIIATVCNKWFYAIHDDIRLQGKTGMLMLTAAIIAYAFFMVNAEMHERYLFPYMVFGLPLLCTGKRGVMLYCSASILFILNLTSIVSFGSFDSWLLQKEFHKGLPVAIATLQVVVFVLTWKHIQNYQNTLTEKGSLLRSACRSIRRSVSTASR